MKAFRKGNSQRGFHQSFRSQSAMEYLMTYGWAILIIAVVLAALFELGVFNPMTFAPKAPPGSCQVMRPEGAGTTNFISLEGECQGELPQYVAQFNGQNSYITASVSQINTASSKFNTISFWMHWNGISNEMPFGFTRYDIYFSPSNLFGFNTAHGDDYGVSPLNLANRWVFVVAILYNGPYTGNDTLYINGVQQTLSGGGLYSGTATSNVYIAYWGFGGSYYFNGSIANVQIYNTALSANDIKALYQEGIGGAPIKIQSLVAWYPLNGNANDYSGNNNNGVPNSVTYTSNWYSGYSAP